ncbi:MAG: hypothetical protein GC164_16310 [Phycisphaera sp.]|nr:hypothetical protein [Phycisphaera sp.]
MENQVKPHNNISNKYKPTEHPDMANPFAPIAPHDPDLYHPDHNAPVLPGPGAVDEQAFADYHTLGYLAVANILTPDEVTQSLRVMDQLVEQNFEGVQPESREPSNKSIDSVRKFWFNKDNARTCGMPIDHPVITHIVSALMYGKTPEIFQTMALVKPPRIGREKPWHQDHAYFDIALENRIVGVWIALDEATIDNGCMQLLEGSHSEPIVHFRRRDWQVCDSFVLGKHSVAAPLKPGSALFFDSLLIHGTPTNHSDKRRRAMQFHYAPKGTPMIPSAEHLAVFGEEGKGAVC